MLSKEVVLHLALVLSLLAQGLVKANVVPTTIAADVASKVVNQIPSTPVPAGDVPSFSLNNNNNNNSSSKAPSTPLPVGHNNVKVEHVSTIVTTFAPVVNKDSTVHHEGSAASLGSQAKISATTSTPTLVGHAKVGHTEGSNHSASSEEVCNGLCNYIKPICDSLAKISPKQMFKIQTQFKTFVQKTNGKLGMCFLEHYSFNPTLKPVNDADLGAICSSRKLAPNEKASFQAFQACANNNWDPSLDKELVAINDARVSVKTHQHPKNVSSVAADLEHDEDELTMISEVVSKVLGDNTFAENNSNVKVIDFSGKTTVKPITISNTTSGPDGKLIKSAGLPTIDGNLKPAIMNDQNTVVVFVDDSKTTTLSPQLTAASLDKTATITNSLSNEVNSSTIIRSNSTTTKPAAKINLPLTTFKPEVEKIKILAHNSSKVEIKDENKQTNATESFGETTPNPVKPTASVTVEPDGKPQSANVSVSTKAPSVKTDNKTTTIVAGTSSSPATSSKPTPAAAKEKANPSTTIKAAPSVKPLESLEQILKRQEKEKQDLETKLRLERQRAIKQLQRKQDELDAKNAMKALQTQRATSDNKVHQIEHERQMAIDPIGHTIKHQQYEASKQQKLTSG